MSMKIADFTNIAKCKEWPPKKVKVVRVKFTTTNKNELLIAFASKNETNI